MDTKLKKFSYKPFKIICIILSIVSLIVGCFSALRMTNFAKNVGYYYGNIDNLDSSLNDARLTSAFLEEMGFVYYALRHNLVAYDNGTAFTDGSLEREFEKYIEKEEAKKAEYEKRYDIDDYDGEHITTYYGEFDYSYNYQDTDYADAIKPLQIENGYLTSYLRNVNSVDYFVVNNKNGKVYTTTDCKTAEEFAEKYKDKAWFVATSDNMQTVQVNSIFERLSEMTASIGYNYEGTTYTDIDSGKVVPRTLYTDNFYNSMCYSYFRQNHSTGIYGSFDWYSVDDCTVMLSFDSSKLTSSDPFNTIYTEHSDGARTISRDAAIFFSSLVILLLCTALIIALAGRKYKGAPIHHPKVDKIWCDLRLLLSGGVVAFITYVIAEIVINYWLASTIIPSNRMLTGLGIVALTVVDYLVLLDYLTHFSRCCKDGTIIKNLLILMPIKLLKKLFKRLDNVSSNITNGVRRVFWIASAAYCACLLISLLCVLSDVLCIFGVMGIIASTFLFLLIVFYYARSLDKIRETVESATNGNFDVHFDCSIMPQAMTRLAHSIEDMRGGMQKAINTAIKEEQTKTELITNVSHDLKTPLTSIITYTDLIKRRNIEDEAVSGYVDVLAEKSLRLKQLIDDLTEATKASTGAVEISLAQVNLYQLALQALGENEDSLQASGIDVRFTPITKIPIVHADGQKTYRVFENVISNIAKYSLPGTRAYVTISAEDGMGKIEFKNISAAPFDVSPDQLMERFVRGDSSRGGEGSGLGLSIARDLCRLQGGKFTIDIDGDLFKSCIRLPLVQLIDNQQAPEAEA